MIPELKTFLIAMSPIIELRGAIPLAYNSYGMTIWSAYFYSVLGNLVPLIGIVVAINPVCQWLMAKFVFFQRFFDWLFAKIKAKTKKLNFLDRNLIIVALTAIPVPLIGGWTGALASFILEVPRKKAVVLVSLGAMISGIIVSVLTLGIINLIN